MKNTWVWLILVYKTHLHEEHYFIILNIKLKVKEYQTTSLYKIIFLSLFPFFQAKSLGLLDPPNKGRGRGVVRGRGRGTAVRGRPLPKTTRVWTRESATLDHRPKQIVVNEVTPEQKEDISEHYSVSFLKQSVQ